jgi:hypothetical protein
MAFIDRHNAYRWNPAAGAPRSAARTGWRKGNRGLLTDPKGVEVHIREIRHHGNAVVERNVDDGVGHLALRITVNPFPKTCAIGCAMLDRQPTLGRHFPEWLAFDADDRRHRLLVFLAGAAKHERDREYLLHLRVV